ncbi:MAG: hypothetical protein N3C63_01925 [Rhodocyclaceae bacterium]|nr:hypothetical protein [Rhodocyclaceae bacterium]
MPAILKPSSTISSFRWLVFASLLVILAGLWLWRDYRGILANADRQQANVARLLETYTTHIITNTDNVLARVIDEVRDHDILGAGADRRWPLFVEMAKQLPAKGRLWLYRADGSAVMASHLRHSTNNANDREYFTAHRDRADIGLFIGETIIGKTTGRRVFNLSRRLETPSGTFAGVAMAAIEVEAFADLFNPDCPLDRAGHP